MNKNFLFAIDQKQNEVIVSESPKGSLAIRLVERISRNKNEVLYNAVTTLESISKTTEFDPALFKQMDKVCQLLYSKHKEDC